MSYRQFEPHRLLSPYIDTYWAFEGHWATAETIKLLPDGAMDLILNLGEEIHSVNNEFLIKHETPYLIGTATQFKEHFLQGFNCLYGVRFRPGAFGCFYSYDSLHLFANQVNEFDPKLFPDIQKLSRFFVPYLDQFFLDRLQPAKYNLQAIVANIHQQKGLVQVDELLKTHFVSERKLERLFQAQIGISPKAFIKLLRFTHTLAQIQNKLSRKSFMELAFECGYYDHAHLANEIKHYTGINPSSIILSDFSKTGG